MVLGTAPRTWQMLAKCELLPAVIPHLRQPHRKQTEARSTEHQGSDGSRGTLIKRYSSVVHFKANCTSGTPSWEPKKMLKEKEKKKKSSKKKKNQSPLSLLIPFVLPQLPALQGCSIRILSQYKIQAPRF